MKFRIIFSSIREPENKRQENCIFESFHSKLIQKTRLKINIFFNKLRIKADGIKKLKMRFIRNFIY